MIIGLLRGCYEPTRRPWNTPHYCVSGRSFIRIVLQSAEPAKRSRPTPRVKLVTSAVVAKVSPTVVQIRASGEETDGLPPTNGSGVIVDPSGFIITNFHVIDGARRIQVTLDRNAP